MLEFKKNKSLNIPVTLTKGIFFCFLLFVGIACKKEKTYVYGINDVTLKQEGANKPSVKTTTEFISIAYADIFGTTITANDLTQLSLLYSAFGDKKLMENLIIKNFLNAPGTQIPSKSQMQQNTEQFLKETYTKFLNRTPNEFELYGTKNIIQADTTISPELIYYGMLTSNEYRHY
jgi:hypothetical protein